MRRPFVTTRELNACLALACVAVAAACPRPAGIEAVGEAQRKQGVVYGEDDRDDVYVHPSTLLRTRAMQSVAAMVSNSIIDFSDPDDIQFNADTLDDYIGLCPGERFGEQIAAADCSGTLIAEDVILTAGHCVPGQSACANSSWAFDYYYRGPDDLETISIVEDLYACIEVITTFNDVTPDGDFLDYALIRLDRPVESPHTPAPVALPLSALGAGDDVSVVGFPSGLPAKIADGATVTDPRAGALDYFTATLDAFGGNSGSGVFDTDGDLVGILVRGQEDYVYVEDQDCFAVNVLPDNLGAEASTYAGRAIEAACSDGLDVPALCEPGGGACSSCDDVSDCPSGWHCLSWADNPEATFCAAPCMTDAQCPDNHTCSPIGSCFPETSEDCVGDAVWTVDACGNAVSLVEDCSGEGQQCASGECAAAIAGDTCASPIHLSTGNTLLVGAVDGALSNAANGSCDSAALGRDQVYTFTLDASAQFTASATGFDTLLHLRRDVCDDQNAEVACDDDSGGNFSAYLDVFLEAGTYFLFLDSWGNEGGSFQLNTSFAFGCGDGCEPGARRCEANGFQICTTDDQGCPVWGPVQGCGGLSCVNGVCTTGCVDDCDAPGLVCASSLGIAECGDFDDDDCLDLAPTVDLCQDGTICVDAMCIPGCVDECADDGEMFCIDGNTLGGCWDADGDSCLDVVTLNDCPFPEVCEAGVCVSTCTDECTPGDTMCTADNRVAICTDMTDSGCAIWGEMPCAEGQVCIDGSCEGECVDVCTPGAPAVCLDDATVGECMPAPPDGCTYYDSSYCALGTHCEAGDCVEGCANQCGQGESRCLSSGLLEVCVDSNADGCFEWAQQVPCPGATECRDGRCQGACDDTCTLGEGRCLQDSQVQTCTDEGTPCATWTVPTACPLGVSCVGGVCNGPCQSECDVGDGRCLAEHVYEYCIVAGEECTVWSGPRFCFGGDVCQGEGVCGAPVSDDAGTIVVERPSTSTPPVVVKDPEGCAATSGSTAAWALCGLAFALHRRRRR